MSDRLKVIDFHAHILPAADHGSRDIEMTSEQLKLILGAGVGTVVATPHFYPNEHDPIAFCDTVNNAVEMIVNTRIDRPELCVGAEVLLCENMENMDGIEKLCIRGTDLLLIELPMSTWSADLCYSLKKLSSQYTVILAHIDRYIESQPDKIEQFISDGALAQINASALFCGSVKKKLLPYISGGTVCAIGSDLHLVDKKSYSQFIKAEKKLRGDYERIMERSSELLKNAIRF